MISGGNATVYVSNMDAAVQFYTETLGLTLTNRFGNHWATLETGTCYWTHGEAGLTIGLHPASPKRPAPGTSRRSRVRPRNLSCRLNRSRRSLTTRGVTITSEIIRYEAGNVLHVHRSGRLADLHQRVPAQHAAPSRIWGRTGVQLKGRVLVGTGRRRTRDRLRLEHGRRRPLLQREARGSQLTNRYGDHIRDRRGRQISCSRSIRRRREHAGPWQEGLGGARPAGRRADGACGVAPDRARRADHWGRRRAGLGAGWSSSKTRTAIAIYLWEATAAAASRAAASR